MSEASVHTRCSYERDGSESLSHVAESREKFCAIAQPSIIPDTLDDLESVGIDAGRLVSPFAQRRVETFSTL